MKISSSLVAIFALHVLASGIAAQSPAPEITLSKPDAEFAEPFSEIASIRELRDGRVIVVDTRERVLKLVDFGRTSASMIGHKGAGPGEYRAPLSVFPLPADSSVVFDGGRTGLLLLGPDGKPGDFVSTATLGTSEGMVTRFVPSRSDSSGRLYATGVPFRMTPNGPQHADSSSIVRWTRGTPEVETVTFIRNRSLRDRGGDVDPVMAHFSTVIPYVVGDQWAVDRDGRIAILRYDNYRVDFVEPSGRRVPGTPIPFARVRVSEAHKESWRDQERVRLAGSPGGGFKEPARWPDFLPPFLNRPAIFSPDGMLWVRRTGAADAPPLYDVIDKTGRVSSRVTLAPRSRVVGFSRGWIYIVRRDQDDLEYLQRFQTR